MPALFFVFVALTFEVLVIVVPVRVPEANANMFTAFVAGG